MPDQPQLRAVLAEDQALLRVGLTRILEASDIAVVAAVDNAPQLEKLLAWPERTDVRRRDRRRPPAADVLHRGAGRRHRGPRRPARASRCWCSASTSSRSTPRDLLASGEGAVGYLLKDRVADVDEFVAAVRRVAAGGTVLDPEVVAGLVAGAGRPARSTGSPTASARCSR